MNSSILAIVTVEMAFLGVRREEWIVEFLNKAGAYIARLVLDQGSPS